MNLVNVITQTTFDKLSKFKVNERLHTMPRQNTHHLFHIAVCTTCEPTLMLSYK